MFSFSVHRGLLELPGRTIILSNVQVNVKYNYFLPHLNKWNLLPGSFVDNVLTLKTIGKILNKFEYLKELNMRHYLKRTLSLVTVLAFVMVFISCSPFPLQADTEEVVKKSFSVGEGGTLWLDTDLGSIVIDTDDTDKINVEVLKVVATSNEGKAKDVFEDFVLDFNKKGNDLTIDGDYKRNNSIFSWVSGKRLKVKFRITVPKKYNLQLKTSGGSINVREIEGNVKAKTSGGSLKFAYIKGSLRGRTSGGSITLEGCDSNAEVNTSGGSIRLGHVKGEVKARTSGGSIKVKEVMGTINASTSGGSVSAYISKQPKSNCRLTTSGGSVTVQLNKDIEVDVDAKTSGGRVRTDFPVTVKGELSKRKLRAKINGGGPELYLRTSGGSIRIKQID
jgi:DUF4097 and DUF4098 domain-containing protein YvlB